MNVAELVATLGLSIDERSFERARQLFTGLSAGVLGIGAAVAGALAGAGALAHGTSRVADEMLRMSQAAGVSAQAFQGIAYASQSVGLNAQSTVAIMSSLARASLEATRGSKDMQANFRRLGITLRDSNGQLRSSDALLHDLSDAFATMPDGVEKTALAQKLLGEEGARMLLVLNQGSAGLRAMTDEAERLGAVLSDDVIAASQKYEDAQRRVRASAAGLRNAIGGPLLEVFADMADSLSRSVRSFTLLFGPSIVRGVRTLTDNLHAVRFVLLTIGGALAANALLATTLGNVSVIAAVKAAAGWVLALAPLLLIGAAIALLVDELVEFVTGGETLLGRFIRYLDRFDPEDSPLVNMLKRAGSLLFDLTDPAKWDALWASVKRVGAAVRDALERPLRAAIGVLQHLPGLGGAAMVARTALDAVWSPSAATPAGTVASSPGASITNNGAQNHVEAAVTVNVSGGSDPYTTGRAAGDAAYEAFQSELRAAWGSF